LAATENPTIPLPEPVLPEVMVIQLALELAVQGQLPLLLVVTPTIPVPPLAGTFALLGPRAKVHGGDAKHLNVTLLLVKPAFVADIVPLPLPLPP
jgi:hypothetical protein